MRTHTLFSLLLLAGSTLAQAGTPINLTHALDADGRISVSNVSGEVTITGWDRPEVKVTGSLGEGAKPLKFEGDNRKLSLKVEARSKSGGWFNWGDDNRMKPTTLNIMVPAGPAGDVDVVSANARLDKLKGGKISVDSVSGQVQVAVDSPEIDIDTVSGDVDLSGSARHVNIDSVSGDLHIDNVGDRGKLESVSGDIRVTGGPFESMTASTVSGDLVIRGGVTDSGKISVETMSGDVTLTLPPATSASISASSFSGDVHSDVGQVSSRKHRPGNELSTRIGEGGGTIDLESFSGDLRIRVGSAAAEGR